MIKRYEYYDIDQSDIHPGFHTSGMREAQNGKWVKYEDYLNKISDFLIAIAEKAKEIENERYENE